MSGRIERRFAELAERGATALIPFVTAGDPRPGLTVDLMHALVEGGADLVELGIPFSDPMADGPVIQAASERAIAQGVNLAAVLDWVRAFRQRDADTPVILMGYLNPIERYGYRRLAEDAASAGVDGMLMVDCPPDEMPDFSLHLRERGIDAIRLVAPTTDAGRAREICRQASGFVYYVSFKGTTGASHLNAAALEAPLAMLRGITDLPIAVGFGIKDGAAARTVAAHADGVVVGSALVAALSEQSGEQSVLSTAREFMRNIRNALDSG